jgi:intermediate filament protein if
VVAIAENREKEKRELSQLNDKFASYDERIRFLEVQEKQIADNKAEINLLKRRLGELEDEAKRYQLETQPLIGEIQRVTAELDSETLQRVQLENE